MDTNVVLDGIYKIVDFTLKYAIVLAASGTLAMALIEAWKKLNNTLAKFHRKRLLLWLTNNMDGSKQYVIRAGRQDSYDAAKAYEQLLFLTTGVGNPEVETGRFLIPLSVNASGGVQVRTSRQSSMLFLNWKSNG